MKTIESIKAAFDTISDASESLRDLLIAYFNENLELTAEKVGAKMRDELEGLKFQTYDSGKSISTMLAHVMADTGRFEKREVSAFLKGLGFIRDNSKNENSEKAQRSRVVAVAFGKAPAKGSKTKTAFETVLEQAKDGKLTKEQAKQLADALAAAYA